MFIPHFRCDLVPNEMLRNRLKHLIAGRLNSRRLTPHKISVRLSSTSDSSQKSTDHEVYSPLHAYNILQVSPKSSYLEKREAYLKLSAKFHPDKNLNDDHAVERFHSIQMAWQEIQRSKDSVDEHGIRTYVCPETHIEIKYDYEVKPLGAVETKYWKSDIDTIRNEPLTLDLSSPGRSSHIFEMGDVFFLYKNANLWHGHLEVVRKGLAVLLVGGLIMAYSALNNGWLAVKMGIATPEVDLEKQIVAHDPTDDARSKLLDLKVAADLAAGKGVNLKRPDDMTVFDDPRLAAANVVDMTPEEEEAEMIALAKSLGVPSR